MYYCSIELLSEDLISSTSDDAVHPELLSLSPSPTFSSTPQPQYQTTQKSKPNAAKNILKYKDGSYDRMFGSHNGINIEDDTQGNLM